MKGGRSWVRIEGGERCDVVEEGKKNGNEISLEGSFVIIRDHAPVFDILY